MLAEPGNLQVDNQDADEHRACLFTNHPNIDSILPELWLQARLTMCYDCTSEKDTSRCSLLLLNSRASSGYVGKDFALSKKHKTPHLALRPMLQLQVCLIQDARTTTSTARGRRETRDAMMLKATWDHVPQKHQDRADMALRLDPYEDPVGEKP
jgi:hypothetical protein